MSSRRFVACVVSVGTFVAGIHAACAQNYPNKPIRLVTGDTGGSNDILARLIAPGISARLGQQVVVDNRGGGVLPGGIVARALPDGHTLLLYSSILWLLPLMRGNVPYDPLNDFSPVTLLGHSPNVLVVHSSLPVRSVNELIALAKARPGELNYSSGPMGSPPHLAAELFKAMAGVSLVQIAYKGGGPALIALLGGQVQLMFPSPQAVHEHIKSGRLRALAVTSAQPSTLLPGLPTMAASGLPGYELKSSYALFAPAKAPSAVIRRLNQDIAQALNAQDVKERLLGLGVEAVASAPEALTNLIKSEMAVLGRVIRDANIRSE
jgi:tripartite-type tricarboxylate transporter receptor subunit TctC